MATRASPDSLSSQARRLYTEELVKGLVAVVQTAIDGARTLMDKPSEHVIFQRRRELTQALMSGAQQWHRGIVHGLREVLAHGVVSSRIADLSNPALTRDTLTLVPDDTIELEIVTAHRGSSPTCGRASPTSKAAPSSTRTTCCAPTSWRASSSTPGAAPG
jgi:hypothetical protein